jgi:ABC-type multidrug transport system fused ATPase/permease subunit
MDGRAKFKYLTEGIHFVSQNPWILSTTILDNILYGAHKSANETPVNYQKLLQCLYYSDLIEDIGNMKDGVLKKVGDRGD